MSKNIEHLQHIKSNVVIEGKPKLPTAEVLVDGELAVNYAEGYETISLRNSNSDITTFSSDDYYTKKKLGSGFTGVNSANTVTSVIEENEEIVSAALNDLEGRKLDASAYTPTDLTNYYTKSETSGATEIQNALDKKADTATTYTKDEVDARDLWASGTGENAIVQKGGNNTASGKLSVAEGFNTIASGSSSHAEGNNTKANGYASHTEGSSTAARGLYSHAEGMNTIASGQSSHAEGNYTITSNDSEHASGQYNVSNKANTTFGDSGNTLFSVGNGTSNSAKHNAFEIRQNGDIYISSGGTNTSQMIKLQDSLGIDLSNYYTKSETSGATEISNALSEKVNTSDIISAITPSNSGSTAPIATKVVAENELIVLSALNDLNTAITAHTANTNIHVTASDKEKLNSLTGTVGTMAYENKTSYSSATQVNTALGNKVDKVSGKGLSTNDYTTDEKNKLSGIAAGAEVNVQSDWNATSGDAFIKNKPTIPTESTVSGWGFTKNVGTITGIKMNGSSKGTSGVVDLGTVITAHQDISKKLNESGDTMTGDLTRKCADVDASKANNNISSTKYPTTFNVTDNSNRILTRKEAIIEPNGNISAFWYVRNYNTSGTMLGQKGIKITMNKSGSTTYTVDEAANFRSAIGAGTSSFSGSYNDLSNKPTIPAAAANGTYTVKTLVGSTTTNVSNFTANQSTADDVTFVQGSNVTITPDATNRKITIAATDTKYTAATAAPRKVASSSAQGSSTNYARQDHTHGIDLATGDSNGQVKIAGTNVSVKGLGSAAYTNSTEYRKHVVADFNGSGSTDEYCLVCTLTIIATYVNKPIEIVLDERGRNSVARLNILFSSVNNTDPTLASFRVCATQNGYYIHKSATSTWKVYATKNETWSQIKVVDYSKVDSGVTITWDMVNATLPSDATQATHFYSSSDTKNTAGTTNKAGTKMFLAAATEQSANPVTYSNSSCYIGTDNCLYSGGAKVLTSHDGNNRKAFYGTCTTAAATKDKVVTLAESAGWPGLVAGVIVGVKFTNTNTYSNATGSSITLNVNSTGAKNIWFGGTHSGAGNTGTNTTAYGRANYINYYMYDGTYWAWLSSSNNTTYTPLSLGFCYGVCSTAAGTAAKTVTMTNYNLVAHGIVSIRFTNAITVANATLNINGKGAKAIYYQGTALAANVIGAGSTVVMQYNGTVYNIIGGIMSTDKLIQETMNRRTRTNFTSNGLEWFKTTLKSAIADMSLEKYGLKVGDYCTATHGGKTYNYVIAGLNTMRGTVTSYRLNYDHVGIIVDTNDTHAWNTSNSTATSQNKHSTDGTWTSGTSAAGYASCDLQYYLEHTVLPNVESDLGSDNIKAHSKYYSNAVNTNGYNRFGSASGCSSGLGWYSNQKICALSEVQVYGSIVWSSSGFDTGEACRQLDVFRVYNMNEIFEGRTTWLRDIASSSSACDVGSRGDAYSNCADYNHYVAALILFA